MFRSSHFLFLVFGHLWQHGYENMKILHNLCLPLWARRKENRKKITQLKWPKYQKPKDENMGWTKQKVHSKSNPSVFVRSFHRCSTKSFTSLRTESFAYNGVKVILNPHLNFFLQNKSSRGFEHISRNWCGTAKRRQNRSIMSSIK